MNMVSDNTPIINTYNGLINFSPTHIGKFLI